MNTAECFKHIGAKKQPYDPGTYLLYADQRLGVFALSVERSAEMPHMGMPPPTEWTWQISHADYTVKGRETYPYQDEAAQAAVKWFDEHERQENPK